MSESYRDTKQEKEDKIRCAAFLLQMIEKYGAEIMEEAEQNSSSAVLSPADKHMKARHSVDMDITSVR